MSEHCTFSSPAAGNLRKSMPQPPIVPEKVRHLDSGPLGAKKKSFFEKAKTELVVCVLIFD